MQIYLLWSTDLYTLWSTDAQVQSLFGTLTKHMDVIQCSALQLFNK